MTKVYSELVYHFVWGTRDRQPLIKPEIEALLVPFLDRKCRALGYHLHAVGCVDDHVHLLVTLGPTVTVAEVAKSLKGSSSHFINSRSDLAGVLYWQRGYGVLSLRKKDVPVVAEYIRRQREHHGVGGRVIGKLERSEGA
jgi:putative transposase